MFNICMSIFISQKSIVDFAAFNSVPHYFESRPPIYTAEDIILKGSHRQNPSAASSMTIRDDYAP